MRSWFVGNSLATLAVVGFLAAPLLARDEARPYLGIAAAAKKSDRAGVLIAQLRPDSPAAKAGLKKGDRIVMAGDKEIETFKDLTKALTDYKPGGKLVLKLMRHAVEQLDARFGLCCTARPTGNPSSILVYSASDSGIVPVSTATRISSGLASHVA